MDLSFNRFERDVRITALPPDLAVMLVGIAARQAASPTARIQARLAAVPVADRWFAPVHGSFNPAIAAAMAGWRAVMKMPFTAPL